MYKSKDLQVKLRKLIKTRGKTQKFGTLGFQDAGKTSKQKGWLTIYEENFIKSWKTRLMAVLLRRFCRQIFMARPLIVKIIEPYLKIYCS